MRKKERGLKRVSKKQDRPSPNRRKEKQEKEENKNRITDSGHMREKKKRKQKPAMMRYVIFSRRRKVPVPTAGVERSR